MNGLRRNGTVATLLATAALGVGACGGDEEESADPAAADGTAAGAVTIRTFMYEPSPLTVPAGTTVTFTNEDDILHTVTSGTRSRPTDDFDEDLDGAGSTAEVTLQKPGEVAYFCDIHQGMDGTVVVE